MPDLADNARLEARRLRDGFFPKKLLTELADELDRLSAELDKTDAVEATNAELVAEVNQLRAELNKYEQVVKDYGLESYQDGPAAFEHCANKVCEQAIQLGRLKNHKDAST